MSSKVHWDVTDENGHIQLAQNAPAKSITMIGKEIVKVGKRAVAYPAAQVNVLPADYEINKKSYKSGPHVGDHVVNTRSMMPPIIVNLRENANPADACTRSKLTPLELNYFKKHGNNALLFIHGFNVPYGEYPDQVEALKPADSTDPKVSVVFAKSKRTIFRDKAAIEQHFKLDANNSCVFDNDFLDHDQKLNGSEAHNWFIHMEDNLNRATNQFNRDNYLKFTRLLHVAWSGDVSAMEYLDAEQPANRAGMKLPELIEQLDSQGITINIIAHSLGARVLLTAMEALGKAGKADILNHVFLWEAAVPNTALSSDPLKDTTLKQNAQFIHATDCAKKITVLYSSKDDVLGDAFWLANAVGVPPEDILFRGYDNERYYWRKSDKFQQRLQHIKQDPLGAKLLAGQELNDDSQHAKDIAEQIHQLRYDMSQRGDVAHALGYTGPAFKGDRKLAKLWKKGKIIPVDQSKWLFSHSGMKIPTQELMEYIYKQWIINSKNGVKHFGNYIY